MTPPQGYRGPLDLARDRPADLVVNDLTAYSLLVEIGRLHGELCDKLDHDVDLAVLGQTEPASGKVTGSNDYDRMDTLVTAKNQAERDRDRTRKNALQDLRRVVQSYEERLGRRPPRRPRVESIDYHNGSERRVG